MILVCLFLFVSDPIHLPDYQVRISPTLFSSLDLNGIHREPQAFEGKPLSVWSTGALVKDETWRIIDFKSGSSQSIEAPPTEPMFHVFPHMDEPCFFQLDSLYIYRNSQWIFYKVPIWYEIREPQPIPGSSQGMTAIFPEVVKLDTNELLVYQSKTGSLLEIDPQLKMHQNQEVPRKMRLIPFQNRLLWVGSPKKGRLSYAEQQRPYKLQHTMKVGDLGRYSPLVVVMGGFWVLTFSESFGDALDSWSSGTVVVKAHFLKTRGKRLVRKSFKLPNLPVDFELNTSNSGSPKLGIDPQFMVFGVRDSDELVVLLDRKVIQVHPNKGVSTVGTYRIPSKEVASVMKRNGLTLLSNDGTQYDMNGSQIHD